MFRTIDIATRISAQGEVVRTLSDGRVTISTGSQLFTGWPVTSLPANGAMPPSRATRPNLARPKLLYPRKSAGKRASGRFW